MIVNGQNPTTSENVKKNEPKKLENIVNFLKKKKVVDSGSNNAPNNLLILEPTNTDKVAMYQTLFENVDMTNKEVRISNIYVLIHLYYFPDCYI